MSSSDSVHFSHIKTPPTIFPAKEKSPVYCLLFLFLAFPGIIFVKSAHNGKHAFKRVCCSLGNNPICQMHCLDGQGGIWISLFLALFSKFTSARFQRVDVYYPLSVWQRCLPAFYALLSIWGYDAVFGSALLYNLSEGTPAIHHHMYYSWLICSPHK